MRVIVSLLVLLTLPALAIRPPAFAAEDEGRPSYQGLWLSTPFPSLSVPVDEPISLDLEVHSSGLPPQQVKLSLSQVPADWSGVFLGNGRPVRSVFVAPDSTAKLTLKLVPPEGIRTGSHQFELAAVGDGGQYKLPIEVSFDDVMPTRLSLEPELPALRGTPTSSFNFAVKLRNDSGREAVARLEAMAPAGFEVTFKERYGSQELTSVPIKAGESRDLSVTVEPHPRVEAGVYQVGVRAATEDDNAETMLALDIVGRPELALTGMNDRLSGKAVAGEQTPLTLIVANRGTAPAQNVEFRASEPSDWNVEFVPESLEALPAGEQREVKALITPSSEAIAGDYMLTLTASGDDASESSEFRITVETSTLWGIIGILVIAAAVVVLALAVLRFGRR